MTKEELRQLLLDKKEHGISYKYLAKEMGISPARIYTFLSRDTADKKMCTILTEYFTKKEEK